jgi:hypothetical protein
LAENFKMINDEIHNLVTNLWMFQNPRKIWTWLNYSANWHLKMGPNVNSLTEQRQAQVSHWKGKFRLFWM